MARRTRSRKGKNDTLILGAGLAAIALIALAGKGQQGTAVPSIIVNPPSVSIPAFDFTIPDSPGFPGVPDVYNYYSSVTGAADDAVKGAGPIVDNLVNDGKSALDGLSDGVNKLGPYGVPKNTAQSNPLDGLTINLEKTASDTVQTIGGGGLAGLVIAKDLVLEGSPGVGQKASGFVSSYSKEDSLFSIFGQGALTGLTSGAATSLAKDAGNDNILGKAVPGGGIVKGVLALASIGNTAGVIGATYENVSKNPSKKTSQEFASGIGGLFSLPTAAVSSAPVAAATGPYAPFAVGLVSAAPTALFGLSGGFAYDYSQKGVEKFGPGQGTALYNVVSFFGGNQIANSPTGKGVVEAMNQKGGNPGVSDSSGAYAFSNDYSGDFETASKTSSSSKSSSKKKPTNSTVNYGANGTFTVSNSPLKPAQSNVPINPSSIVFYGYVK